MKNKLTKEQIEDIKTKILDFTYIAEIYNDGIYKIEILDNTIIIYTFRPGILIGVGGDTIFKLRNYLGVEDNVSIILREPNRNDIIKATNKELDIKEKELVDCYPTVLETFNKVSKIENMIYNTITFISICVPVSLIILAIIKYLLK